MINTIILGVVYLTHPIRHALIKRELNVVVMLIWAFNSRWTCNQKNTSNNSRTENMKLAKDVHTFSRPNEAAVTHLHLDLTIDFEKRILNGFAELTIANKTAGNELHLDSKQLTIEKIEDSKGHHLSFSLSDEKPYLGSDLKISITPSTDKVRIYYHTDPEAEALQWLTPDQTHDKKFPFLFSQSQAILARTWIPIQDSPGVKFTYTANIKSNSELMVLMSAENDTTIHTDGVYHFKMDQPISSYLMAIAAGKVVYKNLGRNSGVYAEPGQLDAAHWEFADMQNMIDSAESLYGPYRWGRYDVLVLPPSFPFGGMENPRLTFATPTIIAGDRSLVSLVAHELAHSWSGNLVTNETWNDFWLNEGFTVYFEQRIMEKIFGTPYSEMLTVLGMGEVTETINTLRDKGKPEDTHLYLRLEGRNPDDGLTDIAYEKGRFFLQTIEKAVGRNSFDAFLRKYFDENAFKPMNTERFIAYLEDNLIKGDVGLQKNLEINAWIYGPGFPSNAPNPQSEELVKVKTQLVAFNTGSKNAKQLETKGWTTHHWLYFLRNLETNISLSKLSELDACYGFTKSGNSEILCDWFKHTIERHYTEANSSLEVFLMRVGRRKFLTPLYERLSKTPENLKWAKEIYIKAKPGYHAVAVNTIEEVLGLKGVVEQ
jgi:aminopeptidase N